MSLFKDSIFTIIFSMFAVTIQDGDGSIVFSIAAKFSRLFFICYHDNS